MEENEPTGTVELVAPLVDLSDLVRVLREIREVLTAIEHHHRHAPPGLRDVVHAIRESGGAR